MRKNLQKQSGLSLDNNHQPKCMWGIFNHLNHDRWNTVKKRLPYRRRFGSKHIAVSGDPESKATASGTSETREGEDHKMEKSPIEAKNAEGSSASKSMKSRLKALITEEVSKRRGRVKHRRSSSCPTHPPPIIHPVPLDVDLSTQTSVTETTLDHHNNVQTSLSSLLDPPLPKICHGHLTPNQTCHLCVEDHTLLQNRLIYAIEPTKTASLQESTLFLKALDLLNMRKEVFMKILQDPSSSLAHHRRASKFRQGFGKSMTFPSPGSSLRGDVKSIGNLSRENGVEKHLCTDPEFLDNVSRHSRNEEKNRHGNRHCLKHFKNLREKLKHAIKEGRKERRIVMDAVIDKIPHGSRMPKDVKEGSVHFHSQFGKTETQATQPMNRASSFHESAERYNQLLESCFQRETPSEKPGYRTSGPPSPATRSPKALERILSLPDLRHYSSSRSEDTFSAGNNLNAVSRRYGEHKQMYTPTGSEYYTLSEANSDENLQDAGEALEETTGLHTVENSAPFGNHIESKTETLSVADSSVDAEKDKNNILMHLHVDDKNKAQFDYVKDILELSGFSGIEFLESWHSAELPLTPSVFKEAEGCLLAQPGCNGNQAGGSCDHLLLFDLINDVLLDMYERSFSYWPKPLTCHSCIRRMPVGYRVLEEVWENVNCLLSWSCDVEQSLDDAVCRDLAKGNNWMNLQFDAECVGLELEELIVDDLLDELIFDDLLF